VVAKRIINLEKDFCLLKAILPAIKDAKLMGYDLLLLPKLNAYYLGAKFVSLVNNAMLNKACKNL
jgi:hypothetical protein